MKITEIQAKPKEEKVLRVAAYARVSADKDAAFHSLSAQREYYEEYVSQHPNWVLMGLYSDNGISGTTINRPEFLRMLQDARDGKIDLIVTKSITRFARNTVILLQTIRELKSLNVDCYFEKENMHSISPDGELLLTLLAMYAEEEARSASENQKWRIKHRFENGEPWSFRMLGYRYKDGEICIVPEEADLVRRIYQDYLSGMGLNNISKSLNESGFISPFGSKWHQSEIRTILTNEKYTGNMLLQKTYREDFRSKVHKDNHGERRQYYVEDSHDPIISQELFDAVQKEMMRRRKNSDTHHCNFDSPFRSIVKCGICGSRFLKRHKRSGKYTRTVWECYTYSNSGKKVCPAQTIPDAILLEKAMEVLSLDEPSNEAIAGELSEVTVLPDNALEFHLKDGSKISTTWKHRSRKDSWTPEMKEAARQRILARYKKEEK